MHNTIPEMENGNGSLCPPDIYGGSTIVPHGVHVIIVTGSNGTVATFLPRQTCG